jgi:hypothetical protein
MATVSFSLAGKDITCKDVAPGLTHGIMGRIGFFGRLSVAIHAFLKPDFRLGFFPRSNSRQCVINWHEALRHSALPSISCPYLSAGILSSLTYYLLVDKKNEMASLNSDTQTGCTELDNVTARDSFLKNPDLIVMTFSHLQVKNDKKNRRCLLNAALTCKDFLDEALDALWEALDSLVPLHQ